MNDETRWLSADELRAWRGLMRMNELLVNRTARSLQREFGLSGADYTILAELTRAPDSGMRILELAKILEWEKSRLSHQLARMAKRDLISHEGASDDKRGTYVTVTRQGHAAIAAAAPRHVQDVRKLFTDHLSGDQISAFAEVIDTLLEKNSLDSSDQTARPE
ncbi:MarR family winged helix-turn-helix transcriptional regulator [Streptomyces sp. NPDC101149]|uniref:MarR family winged helix-turn-helix transcriptional regulator n=1 Tax=Streptomyces sp. NPDC101149 TaxID=3366113 RepID=UPI00383094B4